MCCTVNFVLILVLVNFRASLQAKKIDPQQLKCLVCKTTIKEFDEAIAKIDPSHKTDIGGYRIDSKGNLQQKQVLTSKSETHLSDLAGTICNTMDNYIRGTWKDDGTLTVLKLIENGQMNSKFSLVQIIQDDDLNKSLKYYCEEIIEENEEDIVRQYIDDVENIAEVVCMQRTSYCSPEDFIEKEHVEVPGSEDNFASQFGLGKNFDFNENEEQTEEHLSETTDEHLSETIDELKDADDKLNIDLASTGELKEEL